MRRFDASSADRLVTSISARSDSPKADCTCSLPKPRAQAAGATRQSAATATPVRAKRPENVDFLFKASPNWTKWALVRAQQSCNRV